jgi:tetratricopeptide (TPR) repeat protein
MPYRGEAAPGVACSRHAAAPAVGSCYRCGNQVCEICLLYYGAQPHCPPCAGRARRADALKSAAKVVALLGVIAGVIVFLATRKVPIDHGSHTARIQTLRANLERESCDRQSELDLCEQLVAAGDSRGALDESAAFFKRCGEFPRLRWVTYEAHKQLSEWTAAADEAGKLIEHDPGDKDYWWWRGIAYESAGDDERAIADYRQSIARMPSLNRIPVNLANLLEKRGQFCEAAVPLQQLLDLREDIDGDSRAGLQARVQLLGAACRSKR